MILANGFYDPRNVYNPWMTPNSGYPMGTPMPTSMTMPMPSQIPMNRQLVGRIVSSENDIRPNEVPMDGSISLFLQGDNSCIYAKAWRSDGTIATVKFVPELTTQTPEINPQDIVMSKLDNIESMLAQVMSNKNDHMSQKGGNRNESVRNDAGKQSGQQPTVR